MEEMGLVASTSSLPPAGGATADSAIAKASATCMAFFFFTICLAVYEDIYILRIITNLCIHGNIDA